jgi:hypothetical protein
VKIKERRIIASGIRLSSLPDFFAFLPVSVFALGEKRTGCPEEQLSSKALAKGFAAKCRRDLMP